MSPARPIFAADVPLNTRVNLGFHTFALEEVLAFARAYDPQPFHIDADAARRSHFGAIVASGWHTAAMWMRHSVTYHQKRAAEAQARGETALVRGPGIGFRNLQWLKPVYVGDTITFYSELRERRPSKGRPGWAVITVYNSAINQHADLVMDFEISALQQTPD